MNLLSLGGEATTTAAATGSSGSFLDGLLKASSSGGAGDTANAFGAGLGSQATDALNTVKLDGGGDFSKPKLKQPSFLDFMALLG